MVSTRPGSEAISAPERPLNAPRKAAPAAAKFSRRHAATSEHIDIFCDTIYIMSTVRRRRGQSLHLDLPNGGGEDLPSVAAVFLILFDVKAG